MNRNHAGARFKIPLQQTSRNSTEKGTPSSPRTTLCCVTQYSSCDTIMFWAVTMRFQIRYRLTSSRVFISAILASVILLCQLLLFHYYYWTISNQYVGHQNPLETIYCTHELLFGIQRLALQSDVELVLVDPDVVESTDKYHMGNSNVEFSFSKKSQESTHKSILHFAAVNETSGGQPNLKLFHESLKNNGYIILQYDSNRPMQPEVYRRESHLFDGHHELHGDKSEKISKIYTEFIAHIFVLNRTSLPEKSQDSYRCNKQLHQREARTTVIHIFVLYNYEHNPENQWIQPALQMDELDKHKLLTYNVHWVDFRILIEHHYLHPKRLIASISIANKRQIERQPMHSIRVFEPETDRLLSYANNSFVDCEISPFNLKGLIDSRRRYGKYSTMLDGAKPEPEGDMKTQLQYQIDLALQFMSTYSNVYGNFSHWLTGSSLLSYLKFCDLAIVLDGQTLAGDNDVDDLVREPIINLELGVFASEFNESILEGLANATNIGVKMISDWRRPNRMIQFKLADCPNVLYRIYVYELHEDFYQYYFITQNSMILNQKRKRKRSTKVKINEDGSTDWGHHVFGLHNLELCWTQFKGISKPFRVPCNIHDHLRRIYIV